MGARGTMGLRMSRIMVDAVLNIATLRAYPTDDIRKQDTGYHYSNNPGPLMDKLITVTIPTEYKYPSVFRVKWHITVPSYSTSSVSIGQNGSYVPTGDKVYNNSTGAYPLVIDDFKEVTLGQTNTTIELWAKSGDVAKTLEIHGFSVNCGNESVIEGKNPSSW